MINRSTSILTGFLAIVAFFLFTGCAATAPIGAAVGAAALGALTNAAVDDVNTVIIDANQAAMQKLQAAEDSKRPATFPTPTPSKSQ